MIDGLRPYPEMSPSGVDWLPTLPTGWDIHRAKYSFKEADDRSEGGGEELLSVSHKTGVTPRSQKNITMFMAESYEGHKVCRPGDVVVNTMWAWMAAIGVSRHVGIVSPAYGVYRPRDANRFEPKFLDYLLRTEVYRAEYLRSSRGVTTSRLRLYPPDFLNIPFVQPPLDEQRLIVRFLDWHGAQTAKLIRAKKKIVALLGEQKQAIIQRALTRGFDPNAELKSSAIPWIGTVPVHWAIERLKYVLKEREERKGGSDYELLSLTRKRGLIPQSEASERPPSAEDLSKYKVCYPNDIVMNRMQAWSGLFALAERTGIVSPDYAVFSVRRDIDPEFVVRVLRSPRLVDRFAVLSQGIGDGFNRLYTPALGTVEVALPQRDEQLKIVAATNNEVASLGRAVKEFEKEIGLFQEFRARLVADVVTGKLDVRALAATLPDFTEPKPIGDLVEGDDLDEVLDDAQNEEVIA